MVKQEIFGILRDDDKARRLQTLRHLAETDTIATTSALLDALEEPDLQLSSRAAWILALLHSGETPPKSIADALAVHLQTDPSEEVRVCCAIGLMWAHSKEVEKAYIHALSDKNEKVVSIACGELGSQPSKDAVTALFTMLSHPSWRIRLEVCKSLIKLKAADGRVVSTLEKMTQEPEAIKYDAETEEFHQHAEEIHRQYPNEPKLEMWGKIGEILAQAQQIAAQQS